MRSALRNPSIVYLHSHSAEARAWFSSNQHGLIIFRGRAEDVRRGTMIQALNTALAGYSVHSDNLVRLADRISSQRSGENLAGDMVGMMVNQRAAEANLVVARVADALGESLIHVIA